MADLPTLDPIPIAPEAPSRIEYGQNKAEFRPKSNLFMDWMVTFSEWLNPYLGYIQALYNSVRADTQTTIDNKNLVGEYRDSTLGYRDEAISASTDSITASNTALALANIDFANFSVVNGELICQYFNSESSTPSIVDGELIITY